MIELHHLTKKYGSLTAVDNLSLEVEQGETLALIGTSGCGKTTTLRMINRLTEPSSGQVLIEGEDARKRPAHLLRRGMGYVIQDMGLFPHYTVAQNVAAVPRLLKWPEERIRERVQQMLRQLKLDPEEYAHKYPHQLSGGQQQRVGLARALAGDPPIILMDEPFGALDPVTRADIRSDFLELEELSRKTTIIVTHDIEEAFILADRICLLDQGRVQQIGTEEELLFSPANEFVRRFLADKLLELELHLIRLQDLFAEFPTAKPEGKNEILDFPPRSTVFEAINRLTRHSAGKVAGRIRREGEQRFFELDRLMNAYHRKINP